MAQAKLCDGCHTFVDPRTAAIGSWLQLAVPDERSYDFCSCRCLTIWAARREHDRQHPNVYFGLPDAPVIGVATIFRHTNASRSWVVWDEGQDLDDFLDVAY